MKKAVNELIKLDKKLAANVKAQQQFNLDLSETTIGVDLEFQVKQHKKLVDEQERIQEDMHTQIHGGGTGEQ